LHERVEIRALRLESADATGGSDQKRAGGVLLQNGRELERTHIGGAGSTGARHPRVVAPIPAWRSSEWSRIPAAMMASG